MNRQSTIVQSVATVLRVPISISALILVAWAAASWFLISSSTLALTNAELVDSLILLATSAGVFVSATFVVWSYLQTHMAFALSQKPALLLFVKNFKSQRSASNDEVVDFTLIGYRNTTDNCFYDLTIRVSVMVSNRIFELGDLFTPRMYMAAHDERQRQFVTLDELRSRGLDLNAATEKGNDAVLSVRYEFTFLGRSELVKVQEYKWERDNQSWSIR